MEFNRVSFLFYIGSHV